MSGSTIVVPSEPSRKADNEYTYEFIGWDKNVPLTCTEDLEFVAQYKSTKIEYTVKFINWDDQVVSSEIYNYGDVIEVPQNVIKVMKELQCEANAGNLGVYLFDENGKIEALQDATTATTYYPIPIRALFIGSKIHGNFDAKDMNAISWHYPDNYSDQLAIITPTDFNPLVDLVPATPAQYYER